jgi:signal transduction histidine kinase
VLEERDRIARDLHDIVIQRLFAAGIGLQGVSNRLSDPLVAEEIERTTNHLDQCIREIRDVIFGISTRRQIGSGLRAAILRVLSEEERALGFGPRIHLEGVIEAIPDDVGAHLIATLREALSNAARHAHASSLDVFINARDGVMLRVVDNGVGPPDRPSSGSGLPNMSARAAKLGGSFRLAANPAGGTALEWCARCS